MSSEFQFSFSYENLRSQLQEAVNSGYKFISCLDYYNQNFDKKDKIIVFRIDVDFSLTKCVPILKIMCDLGVTGSFFVRLHAPEYNPFSFQGFRVLNEIKKNGHEIGLHSEIIDQSVIWNESADDCLKRDISILEILLGDKISGVASHGGITGLNNLDFWNFETPDKYGLKYEAYGNIGNFNLFENSIYISDSAWTHWKCYKNGKLQQGDNRSLGEHLKDGNRLIYLLIHPDTYYENHIYE